MHIKHGSPELAHDSTAKQNPLNLPVSIPQPPAAACHHHPSLFTSKGSFDAGSGKDVQIDVEDRLIYLYYTYITLHVRVRLLITLHRFDIHV